MSGVPLVGAPLLGIFGAVGALPSRRNVRSVRNSPDKRPMEPAATPFEYRRKRNENGKLRFVYLQGVGVGGP